MKQGRAAPAGLRIEFPNFARGGRKLCERRLSGTLTGDGISGLFACVQVFDNPPTIPYST